MTLTTEQLKEAKIILAKESNRISWEVRSKGKTPEQISKMMSKISRTRKKKSVKSNKTAKNIPLKASDLFY